ncbi:hypothetical protein [Janthinobacterium sp. PSPC2-1]|uniref:hypothetical protein n=1 Tax=unclassified Janthinobacterium TaxID=2610881 RepID=UPI003CF07B94
MKNGRHVEFGDVYWYVNGTFHREDAPAIEYQDGTMLWYANGEKHREDGPACELSDGSKFWYRNGLRHREDGPANEYFNGTVSWYLNGRQYLESEFNEIISNKKLSRYTGEIIPAVEKSVKEQSSEASKETKFFQDSNNILVDGKLDSPSMGLAFDIKNKLANSNGLKKNKFLRLGMGVFHKAAVATDHAIEFLGTKAKKYLPGSKYSFDQHDSPNIRSSAETKETISELREDFIKQKRTLKIDKSFKLKP